MQTVALMTWHSQTYWQVAELCSTLPFLFLTSRPPYFSVPCNKNHHQTKNILQFHVLKKDGKSTMYNVQCTMYNKKHGFCQIL